MLPISRVKLVLEPPLTELPRVRVRHWLLLAVALVALNASVTFRNVWPTLWVLPRAELSADLAVLLLALVAWTSFVRPLGRVGWWLVALLVLVFVLGRYAQVTAPALYGRPVNLYWDAQHLPKIAAMLATAGPWWLPAATSAGAAASAADDERTRRAGHLWPVAHARAAKPPLRLRRNDAPRRGGRLGVLPSIRGPERERGGAERDGGGDYPAPDRDDPGGVVTRAAPR
jgi:hypothetical protein